MNTVNYFCNVFLWRYPWLNKVKWYTGHIFFLQTTYPNELKLVCLVASDWSQFLKTTEICFSCPPLLIANSVPHLLQLHPIFCSITPPPSLQLPHITNTYKSTSVSNASGHTCSPTLRSPSPVWLFISATCCQVRNHTLRTKVLHLQRVRILLFSLFFLAHARKHARTRTHTKTPTPQLQQTNK